MFFAETKSGVYFLKIYELFICSFLDVVLNNRRRLHNPKPKNQMSIEEDVYHQEELWGEHPQIPQWEAVADRVILEQHLPPTSEVSSCQPPISDFKRDWWNGDI